MNADEAKKTAAHVAGGYLRIHISELVLIAGSQGMPAEDVEQLVDEYVAIGREIFGRAGVRVCRSCLCSEYAPCSGGCSWVAQDLCSSCSDSRIVTPDSQLVVPR